MIIISILAAFAGVVVYIFLESLSQTAFKTVRAKIKK